MPARSEFGEKDYEGLLYPALSATQLVWTPDQVLENHLGFDAAMECVFAYWEVVGRRQAPGVVIASYGLDPLLPPERKKETLPDFTSNLFIQAKRTWEYLRRPPPAVEEDLGPPCRYFEIEHEQQDRLCILADHLGARADVSYACANFMTKEELFTHAKSGDLVHNSVFPTAKSLAAHERCLFDSAGGTGLGLSEPEPLELRPLVERLAELEGPEPGANQNLQTQLARVWRAIGATWGETEAVGWAFDLADEVEVEGVAGLAARLMVFLDVLDVAWMAVGPSVRRQS